MPTYKAFISPISLTYTGEIPIAVADSFIVLDSNDVPIASISGGLLNTASASLLHTDDTITIHNKIVTDIKNQMGTVHITPIFMDGLSGLLSL